MSMKCNTNGNFDDLYSVLAGFADTSKNLFEAAFGAKPNEMKFSKFGNALTLAQTVNHLAKGEVGNAIQDVATWYASNKMSSIVWHVAPRLLAFTPASTAVLAAVAGVGLAIYIGGKIDGGCDKDPTEDFKPNKDESPTQGYIKKYYDPIILDLDGNGVGTVSKFDVLFMMNGGAMFDHDGDGIATQAGWVAVNDELWEMVV